LFLNLSDYALYLNSDKNKFVESNFDSDKLEEYLLEDATDHMPISEAFDLFLLVIGEKPGASVTIHFQRLSNDFKKFVEDFSEEFGLYYLMEKDEQGSQEENFSGNTVFFTNQKDRLEKVKPVGEASTTDIGLFLGYPGDAVESFESSTGFTEAYKKFEEEARKENVSEDEALEILENASSKSYGELFQEKLEELKENETIDSKDLKYLELVSYVPEIEESSVLEAIKEGKRREKSLKKLDEKGFSIGEKFLRKIM